MRLASRAIVCLACLLLSCGRLGYASHVADGGVDRPDAPTARDAGGPIHDGGGNSDAGRLDAGRRDGGGADSGARDAGVDAGVDAGPVCAFGEGRTCTEGGYPHCSAAGTWCQCEGATASGSPGGWVGCRGNGLAVCQELTVGYPCYWENHPTCAMNSTCMATYFTCNRDCTAPSAADACMCVADASGWLGCSADGCGVCEQVLVDYPCYFENHWACQPTSCGASRAACDTKCPNPSEADRGTR